MFSKNEKKKKTPINYTIRIRKKKGNNALVTVENRIYRRIYTSFDNNHFSRFIIKLFKLKTTIT